MKDIIAWAKLLIGASLFVAFVFGCYFIDKVRFTF